jgi:RNA polymerase sigma-70 factor (ECF subfamily)
MAKTVLTDEQIVVAVRSNNSELYSEIIQRYQSKLSHYLKKFIRDNDELEDVLQSVFIKAYKNLNSFNINKRFSPWIYRIAHNEAINHLKKNSKYSLSLDDSEYDVIDEKLDINKDLDEELTREKINLALSSIKQKYREPIILFFFEQKTYEEISEILRLPINTVGTLIARGKQNLKKIIDQKKYGR